MDVLVTLATSISYAYSLLVVAAAVALALPYSPMTFFDTSPMLFLCLSLGRWLEYLAKARTSDAIARLMCLQAADARLCELEPGADPDADPTSCRVLAERCVPAELVKRGDLLKVLPGASLSFLSQPPSRVYCLHSNSHEHNRVQIYLRLRDCADVMRIC